MEQPQPLPWSRKDMPDLNGKVALIVGGTSGIGFEVVKALVGAGAEVFLLIHNNEKGEQAMERVKAAIPSVKIFFLKANLASLESIADVAKNYNLLDQALDILVYNVNLDSPPTRKTTVDGIEAVMGVNYLAQFALVAQLLPSLKRSSSPRVVTVTGALMRDLNPIDYEDFQVEKSKYNGKTRGAQSRLANVLFSLELQRRSDLNGWKITATAINPGIVKQDFASTKGNIFQKLVRWSTASFVGQFPSAGADYILFAATSATAEGGKYYGPSNITETRGNEPSWSCQPLPKQDFIGRTQKSFGEYRKN